MVLLIFGLYVPVWLEYYTHETGRTTGDSSSRNLALAFIVCAQLLCIAFSQIPTLLLGDDKGICLAKTSDQQIQRYHVRDMTFKSILFGSVFYLVIFRFLVQRG